MMCTRSAYEDKTCGYSHCNHNHFPAKLWSTMPSGIKSKLQEWVASQPNISWSTGAVAKWANSEGN
jgi:hypothetical protein